ncbi:MAG: Na/Pi symporter [Clostridia bacterium]|nr:Na/Pi symporter [Clostridia bacterium]
MLIILLSVSAGLALLFFGMQLMKSGLEQAAQNKIKAALNLLTKTPWLGMITGMVITALVQSSTAVTVLSIGLVNARIMSFAQAVGIILGTNIGTCVTALLISFNLEKLAVPAIGLGATGWFLGSERLKYFGQALMGFGVVFLGMNIMAESLQPLKDYPVIVNWLAKLSTNPLLGVLAGTVFTALIHSSSATIGVVIALSSQNLMDLPGAIAIILGSNIGTCITGVLSAIGTSTAAKRVAAAHVLLNVIGAAVFLPLIHPFSDLINATTDQLPRQVANAHTIFNIVSSLAVIPFVNQFSRLVERVIRE